MKGEWMEEAGESFESFINTIGLLRQPGGCPWDREQTHASIARNMIEEAYEAVDAIDRGDMDDLREELGDVLLQVVLQARMASEEGAFTITDVVKDINSKIIRRHPHVFGSRSAASFDQSIGKEAGSIESILTPEQVLELWDQIKLFEKQEKSALDNAGSANRFPDTNATNTSASNATNTSASNTNATNANATNASNTSTSRAFGMLDSIPQSLPALMQAQDISRKAVSAGFEWEGVDKVWDQVFSEIDEFRAEETGSSVAAQEFGDILFSLVNVARKEGLDAESALRLTCQKFRQRWAIMEADARTDGKHISEYSTEELERLWQNAKAFELCLEESK